MVPIRYEVVFYSKDGEGKHYESFKLEEDAKKCVKEILARSRASIWGIYSAQIHIVTTLYEYSLDSNSVKFIGGLA